MKRGNVVLPRFGWDGPDADARRWRNQRVKADMAAAARQSTRPRMPTNLRALPMGSLGFDFFLNGDSLPKSEGAPAPWSSRVVSALTGCSYRDTGGDVKRILPSFHRVMMRAPRRQVK